MRNFINLFISVSGGGIAPITIIFALFQKKTEEGKKRGRMAILIGLGLALIISILIYFVPAIEAFSNDISEIWIGSLLHTFVLLIILLLSLIGIFLDLRKNGYQLKTILLWGVFILVSFSLIMHLTFSRVLSSMNSQSYYFERLDLDQLWEHSTGYGQSIAIIDSGITDEAKELFYYNIVDVYNAFDSGKDVTDEDESAHGTQMASIIVGYGESDVHGIAPSAELVIIKAFEGYDSQTSGETLSTAIDYAILQEVDIISMSFGSYQVNDDLEQAIERAMALDIVVVAATGDHGHRDSLFPARMDGVVSVRARDHDGNFWRDSNLGENDIMSMYGVDIRALTFENEYIEMTGTSHATALASGYIALIRDYHYQESGVQLSNDEVLDILIALDSNLETDVDFLLPFQK